MVVQSDLFNEIDKEKIKSFKYKGKDDSIYYRFISGPISGLIVEYLIPKWLA